VKQLFLLTGFLFLAPGYALAQVTVNQAALQQLAGIEPPPPIMALPPAPVMHHWHHASHTAVAVAPAKPAAPVQVSARVVPPKVPRPAAPALPAAPKPPAAVSLVFAPGSPDLPANATAALKPFCTAPGQVTIDARAPTDPSDPSAAMRLSLARALAVRDALSACGLSGQSIIPRALGDVPGQDEDEAVIGSGAK
jgi:hypothetical protein